MSLTQLYSENNNLKAQLEQEKRERARRDETIDSMMQDLEAAQPQIDDYHTENHRLETEIAEMSAVSGAAEKERDQAVKEARKGQAQVAAKVKEGKS